MSSELINEKIKWLEGSKDLKDSKPPIPVRDILDEAENLYQWCLQDKEKLLEVSRDWQLFEDLPVRTGALRKVHATWITEYKTLNDSKKQWKAASVQAKDLRKKLERYLSFALRDLPKEYAKVIKIKEGYSNADMIQDLSDLAELGSHHKEKLESVGMDLKLLDLARSGSTDLLSLLGKSNSSVNDSQPALELKNKAYHHLKEAIDEIRRRGKFALQDDQDRIKGYYSDYIKRHNQKSRNNRKNPGNDQQISDSN